ncbi:hypothetical protein HDU93_007134, partial [Gonapodya sp. JEL0774]
MSGPSIYPGKNHAIVPPLQFLDWQDSHLKARSMQGRRSRSNKIVLDLAPTLVHGAVAGGPSGLNEVVRTTKGSVLVCELLRNPAVVDKKTPLLNMIAVLADQAPPAAPALNGGRTPRVEDLRVHPLLHSRVSWLFRELCLLPKPLDEDTEPLFPSLFLEAISPHLASWSRFFLQHPKSANLPATAIASLLRCGDANVENKIRVEIGDQLA